MAQRLLVSYLWVMKTLLPSQTAKRDVVEKAHHELSTAVFLADEARFEVARKMTEVREISHPPSSSWDDSIM